MGQVTNVRHGLVPVATAALTAALLLAGCSSTSEATPTESASSSPTTAVSVAPSQTVAMGATATVPTDTITVTSFLDNAAPKATKPDTPATHWASAAVKQCATAGSSQGKWEISLTDGAAASEATSWVEGQLPRQLQPSDEPLAAGDCVSGNVYFVMPDGATATGVVLRTSAGGPVRPQVTWTIS